MERAVLDPGAAVFRLNNQVPSGWDKALILRDGEGGEFVVLAKGFSQVENGLWAHQLDNGQGFTFRKPGFAGVWIDAFSIAKIGGIHGGDLVTFTWTRDSV